MLVSGHVTDTPDRNPPRFPEAAVEDVRSRLAEELDRIGIGPSDLLICGGARGTDLLAAEEALRRCSTVWVLLALAPEEFVRSSVATEGRDWESRFWHLLQRAPAWHLEEELQDPPQGDEVFVRANDWMLKVAKAQAIAEDFHVIVVWDGEGAAGPGGTGEMVELARMAGADFTVLHPCAPDRSSVVPRVSNVVAPGRGSS